MKTHDTSRIRAHARTVTHHIARHKQRIKRHFKLTLLTIPLVLFGSYLAWAFFAAPAPVQKKPLNVILLSIDSLRTDHMGTYGYSRNTTPHIDDWAKDAVVFKNYFSASYLTPISEVSVHTGKYPFTTGVVNFQETLPTSTPNLAKILKEHGYQTGAFGTSAEFSGYNAGYSLSRGFDVYSLSHAATDVFNGRGGNPIPKTISWIESARKKDRPFFAWIPIGSVHWPYGQTEPHHFSSSTYAGYFENASFNTWGLVDYVFDNKVYGRYTRGGKLTPVTTLKKEDFDYLIDRYDDGIVMTDRRVGELFKYIKSSGLDENTVVILESEHGEGFNERGYVMHYDIYDEQTHTPLIIKVPKLNSQQITSLASGVDVLPTLLSILELPQVDVEGYDLYPLMQQKSESPRDVIYITRTAMWERIMSDYENLATFLTLDDNAHFADVAIRSLNWKLIHRRSRDTMRTWSWHSILTGVPKDIAEYELYNLDLDPGEKENLYERERQNPEVVYLESKLSKWEEKQFKTQLAPQRTLEIQPYF